MNADELLGDLAALRRRTRADRRGYAFPLFLFGGLILLAPLTYVAAPPLPPEPEFEPVPIDRGPFPQFVPRCCSSARAPRCSGSCSSRRCWRSSATR